MRAALLALAVFVGMFAAIPAATGSLSLPGPLEEEVTIPAGGHTLAGTLTLPNPNHPDGPPRPLAAIVLISGSGPSDRNETMQGLRMQTFKELANLLGGRMVVLRYDDRGVGASTGDFALATGADFADDAEAAFAYLRTRPEIDPERIGLLGHSEGGMIAPVVAARNSGVAFVVSLAGVAVTGHDLLVRQLRDVLADLDVSEDRRQAMFDAEIASLDEVVAQDWTAAEARLRAEYAAMPDAVREKTGSVDDYVAAGLTYVKGWLHHFAKHDPAADWRKVTVPVLALFGDLDRQVPADQNAPALEAAVAHNPRASVVRLPGTNHLFQDAKTGTMEEYAILPPHFSASLHEALGGWLSENVLRH